MDESRMEDIPQVTQEENDILVALILRRRLRKRSSSWNTIRRQDRMVSWMNFFSLSGI
jgi:hypothetical protein